MMTSNSATPQARSTPVWALPDALIRLRPRACGLLLALNERTWQVGDPVLLELARLRVAQLLGSAAAAPAPGPAELAAKIAALPDYPASPLFSAAEREVVAFTEQFVIDVSGTTEDARAALAGRFGADGARALVSAVYVVEFTQRLQLIAGRLLADAAGSAGDVAAIAGPGAGQASPAELLTAYQEAVVSGSALDPVTTELVRLRCARTHNCRICRTLRLADARAAGVDEAMTAQVDRYERSDLPERAKVALRVTDAFITQPDLLTEAVTDQARACFGPAELASLGLDITKWSTQKIHVALGTDGADNLVTDEDGVALFGFDPAGRPTGYRRR